MGTSKILTVSVRSNDEMKGRGIFHFIRSLSTKAVEYVSCIMVDRHMAPKNSGILA